MAEIVLVCLLVGMGIIRPLFLLVLWLLVAILKLAWLLLLIPIKLILLPFKLFS